MLQNLKLHACLPLYFYWRALIMTQVQVGCWCTTEREGNAPWSSLEPRLSPRLCSKAETTASILDADLTHMIPLPLPPYTLTATRTQSRLLMKCCWWSHRQLLSPASSCRGGNQGSFFERCKNWSLITKLGICKTGIIIANQNPTVNMI